jgi:hypothetical protein
VEEAGAAGGGEVPAGGRAGDRQREHGQAHPGPHFTNLYFIFVNKCLCGGTSMKYRIGFSTFLNITDVSEGEGNEVRTSLK